MVLKISEILKRSRNGIECLSPKKAEIDSEVSRVKSIKVEFEETLQKSEKSKIEQKNSI